MTTVVFVVLSTGPAVAHTGFESSSPSDGAEVDEPVDEITLTFSGEALPVGDGFIVLDPTGTIRQPDDITTTDNLTWVLRFDEPLAGGDAGVRWTVAAPDAHPIDGSFRFTITAPVPSLAGGDPDGLANNPTGGESTSSADRVLTPGGSTSVDTEPASTTSRDASRAEREPVDLESFLGTAEARPAAANAVAALARVLSVLGAVLVVGGAVFTIFALRGDRGDVEAVLSWVARGGILLVVGTVAEAGTTTAILAGEWSAVASPSDLRDALWSSAGLALALRAGGGLLATTTSPDTTSASPTGDLVLAGRRLATIGGGHSAPPDPSRTGDEPFAYGDDHAWDHRRSVGGLVGVALVAMSFMFDGHTASEGPRVIHALVNVTHVTAAATWAGGAAMLAMTIRRRHAGGRPTRTPQLAMRFSVIATAALLAAGLAGAALSIFVADSISDLWSTPWGRLLALKLALVGVAVAGGAYNHRIIVPALERDPRDQQTIDRFRTIITVEGAVLLGAAIVTAFLVAASAT